MPPQARPAEALGADVVVVGAGPAGCAAAITLARAGRDVVVVDRARFPRDKCCGDGLTTGALRHLEGLGLVPGRVESWIDLGEVWARSPSGRVARFPLASEPGQDRSCDDEVPFWRINITRSGTYAAVARRFDLDWALVELARDAGAHVLDGHALTGAGPSPPAHRSANHPGTVAVEVDGVGTILARYVIGADGMWSPLRKHLGVPGDAGYLGEWHAIRQYFAGVAPDAASQLWVWLEPDLLPGYAWSFPVGGGAANVGIAVRRRARPRPAGPGDLEHQRSRRQQAPTSQGRSGSGQGRSGQGRSGQGRSSPGADLARLWAEVVDRPHVRQLLGPSARPEGHHRAWPIPSRLMGSPLSAIGGRALFVGDAARAADPLTGEGIGQALETGALAARAVLEAGASHPERAARSYRRAVGTGLGVDNRLAAGLSMVLASTTGARGAVRVAGATPWSRRQFGRWLFEDYPRAMAVTPWRWRRGSWAAPGAWPGPET